MRNRQTASEDDGDWGSPLAALPQSQQRQQPTPAAVEAGDAKIQDHVGYFSGVLSKATLSPFPDRTPHLSVAGYRKLYEENFGSPRETASVYTGSLLIWDTGTYTVLDRKSKHAPAEDPDSQDTVSSEDEDVLKLTEQEKLHRAFQDRKIRIQLHGTRLPKNYVLNLRLTTQEDAAGRAKADRKPTTRRRRRPVVQKPKSVALTPMTSSSDNDSDSSLPSQADNTETGLSKRKRGPPKTDGGTVAEDEDAVLEPVEEAKAGISAMEKELRELEDETVRRTNAYIGATNTINSIHQRKWYLSLDREACGFVKKRRQGRIVWEPNATVGGTGQEDDQGTEQNGGDGTRTHRLRFPFYVQGSEVERSVVTRRKGADVLKDEGVVGFVPRKGWKAVLR
ncbi:abc1 containing protein [Apiospora marii]|uniref:Abc1 containing protein n=1 Tax=Apiospora marii TaxID=335849 RepID=A0ABR1RD31_9PEZI